MENKKIPRKYGVLYGIAAALFLVVSIAGIYQYQKAQRLALAVENQYVHAFTEVADYMRDVEVLLEKTTLVSDPGQLAVLSSEVYRQASGAKANLALLPVAELNLSGTSKFLSHAGDYTAYLASKVLDSGEVTEEEYKNLEALADYGNQVNAHLEKLQDKLYSQSLSIHTARSLVAHAEEEEEQSFSAGMEEAEKVFQDYPSLIYDGPFSEHLETTEPVMIKDELRITQEEALKRAKEFFGDWRSRSLEPEDEGKGRIDTYNFTTGNKGREISISVTKQGGRILYFLDNRDVSEENISMDEAIHYANEFLSVHGFGGMESSYYDRENGIATINFAAVQDGVILYSDLVKVKVALDNGEILGMEAGGYMMSHTKRELPATRLSAEEATGRINKRLSVDHVRLALIPLESRREVLCYECRGTYKERDFLIYVNAETGKEEKILMLVHSENGILTV
ncbi:MAG: germination protein YpeB [Ruminococcaceae bacterium]|nr:germination protein YpeB [Oscillospiraceae bacterium]